MPPGGTFLMDFIDKQLLAVGSAGLALWLVAALRRWPVPVRRAGLAASMALGVLGVRWMTTPPPVEVQPRPAVIRAM